MRLNCHFEFANRHKEAFQICFFCCLSRKFVLNCHNKSFKTQRGKIHFQVSFFLPWYTMIMFHQHSLNYIDPTLLEGRVYLTLRDLPLSRVYIIAGQTGGVMFSVAGHIEREKCPPHHPPITPPPSKKLDIMTDRQTDLPAAVRPYSLSCILPRDCVRYENRLETILIGSFSLVKLQIECKLL